MPLAGIDCLWLFFKWVGGGVGRVVLFFAPGYQMFNQESFIVLYVFYQSALIFLWFYLYHNTVFVVPCQSSQKQAVSDVMIHAHFHSFSSSVTVHVFPFLIMTDSFLGGVRTECDEGQKL